MSADRRHVVYCTTPGCGRPCAILIRESSGDLVLEILHRHGMDGRSQKHLSRIALADLRRIAADPA